MEAELIKQFLPDLVTAISDCVLSVSDQCLAKGLITESTYKRVLESGWTSMDRARTLLLAIHNSTETDSRCLEIFLSILDEVLPRASREKLLSDIRKEVTEEANKCRAVVPPTRAIRQLLPPGELTKESALQQSSLLGIFEYIIRQSQEKNLLEERLKVKSEECKQLQGELETLRGQNLLKERSQSNQIGRLNDDHQAVLLKQLKKHSAKWKEIGLYLGFTTGELNNIEVRPLLAASAPISWLSTMLAEWLQWAPEDSRGSTSFAMLDDLKAALREAGFGATAYDLKV